jgi:transcriptional regulator GlxA family with amidase domain
MWIMRQLSVSPDGACGVPDSLLERAQDWLADRFSQPIRIEELAAAIGVDRRTLHRHFVKGTGQSPIAFLQSLRIEAAKRMLERTSFPIERIASLVGYTDAGFFRGTFHRSTGKNPRRWRLDSRSSPM